jgi:hypothetical protein
MRHFIAKDVQTFALLCEKRFKIDPNTAKTWYGTQGIIPKGINLLYVQTILVEQGYVLSDIQKLDPVLQKARVFLANGDLNIDDIQSLWGIERGSVWRVLFGYRVTSSEKIQQLKMLIARRFGGLDSQRPAGDTAATTAPRKRAVVTVTEVPHTAKSSSIRNETIAITAALIQSLHPLVRRLASDDFSKEERTALRTLLGEGVIQDMRIAIGKLVSEKTRSLIIEKQNEEKRA